ncbi:hypothetical protein AVEN_207379-1 [Araneus ventricosus]|uniref:RING-type domain-containing protein n=1 Tax=Araneus ventricosus TaxID=182803 RepID=A0A4Y2QGK5_ARAVE|nr:hypothetical protein AVEN_207379-1 [Araneus ventricosus]
MASSQDLVVLPEPDDCGYCLCSLLSGRLQLACGHQYHAQCLKSWWTLAGDGSCPVCLYGMKFWQCGRCFLIIAHNEPSYTLQCECIFHRTCIEKQCSQGLKTCTTCNETIEEEDLSNLCNEQMSH